MAQVDRRGPGFGEQRAGAVEGLPGAAARQFERNPVGGGDADQGRATDRQPPNRRGHLGGVR
jgi:hypothetical protein